MGLANWMHDQCSMMMRTKPHYISILGRKRSSIRSPPKFSRSEGKCGKRFGVFICIIMMFCSITYGVLLILSGNIGTCNLATQLVSLGVAGLVAISGGICLSEYINNQYQEVPSIYSCCYQYSSEIFAFFIGWTWIMSQTAVISAICKLLTLHIDDWSGNAFGHYLGNIFHDYAKDVPSIFLVLIFIIFNLTGFGGTLFWYVLFVPVAFVMLAVVSSISCAYSSSDFTTMDSLTWENIEGIDKILCRSAISLLFFTGPQSILRVPLANVRKNTTAVLIPLNGIIVVLAFVFILLESLTDQIITYPASNELLTLAINVLYTLSLCTLAIESFHPLNYVIEDMASDGLLFRSFSKKWKPFCLPVVSCAVHLLCFVNISVMSVLMPLLKILKLAAVFPLLINTVVPFLVLTQRYRDNKAWQYEPMFHTAASTLTQDNSRKKSLEFQYSNVPGLDITKEIEISNTCIDELGSTTSSDSETDIDAIVKQYKDQTRVSNTDTLDDPPNQESAEPTPSSSFKAKFGIVILLGISITVAVTVNFADSKDHFSVIVVALLLFLLSTVVQGLLLCLPQNQKQSKEKVCCPKMSDMPWTPGIASLIATSLLVHSLVETWRVCLGCFVVGLLLYFSYGIHSSTAANSFHNMRTTHINLRPLPSYGNNCVTQIIPAQKKAARPRKAKRTKSNDL